MIADAETLAQTLAQPLAEPAAALPTEEQLDDVFYRGVLLDITGAARDFAQLLFDTAQRARDPAQILHLAAAFERVSRSARRGILLARHVRKPIKADAPDRSPKNPPNGQPGNRQAGAPNPPKRPSDAVPVTGTEAQQREIRDRLDTLDADLAISFPDNQIPAAIASLRRDLQQAFEELSKPLYKPKHTPAQPPAPDD